MPSALCPLHFALCFPPIFSENPPNFVKIMVRPLISYVLASLILLSQVGLPLHFHYCKGILESVALVFNSGCDDHEELANLPQCCKKEAVSHCDKTDDNCCDDEVVVLTQDITSITPHFAKWIDFVFEAAPKVIPENLSAPQSTKVDIITTIADTGPPIYILHQALIFYA
jgi:hypothetical protein